jgi:hypothetical protein
MRSYKHWLGWTCLVVSCAVGCGAPTPSDPAEGEEVGTETEAFNPSPVSNAPKGHVRITNKAIEVLKSRNLLPAMLNADIDPQASRNIAMLHYGNNFADHPDVGWPRLNEPTQAPNQPVPNFMTPRMQANGGLPVKNTVDGYVIPTGISGAHVDVYVDGFGIMSWTTNPEKAGDPPVSAWLKFTLAALFTADGPTIPLVYDSDVQQSKDVNFGVDNMYHYGLGDLKDFKDPSIGDGETRLRSYPFYPSHIPEVTNVSASLGQTVADRFRNQGILVGADYGVTKYGAILYQLARRFFQSSSQPAPRLADLVKVGNDIPGWHTGWMKGHGGFSDMSLEFPHNFLGGMPYVCTGYSDPNSLDTCATGNPTWPVWIIDSETVPTASMLVQTQNGMPPRSNRTALGYLGWAAHMMQDASLPHHVASWSGPEHQNQDNYGDADYYYNSWQQYVGKTITTRKCIKICSGSGCTFQCWNVTEPDPRGAFAKYWLDPYMQSEVDQVFGPAGANKSRTEICQSLGVTNDSYTGGGLNWERVQPVFLANAKKAYYARQEQLQGDAGYTAGREYVKNAVLGTAKLILCAIPDGTVAPTVPSAARPRAFEHAGFVGRAQDIEPGIYDVNFAGPHGLRVADNMISSLLVPSGYQVTLFDNSVTQGVSSLFTTSGDAGSFNDVASSLFVTRNGESGSFFIRLKRDYDDVGDGWTRQFGLQRYLTVNGSGDANDDVHRLLTSSTYGSGLGEWRYDPASRAIINTKNGLCLDIPNATNANNTTVQLYPCHSGANQQWTITPSGQIKSANGGRCLSAAKPFQLLFTQLPVPDMTAGINVTTWDCLSPEAQSFQLDYACRHDACSTGERLAASCSPDVADVCAADPYCCNTFWDGLCIGELSPKCQ